MAKAKKVTISAILVAVIVACSIPLFSGCGETEHTYSEFQLAYQDFVEEYRLTIETLAPRKVFVISILPRNFDSDDPSLNLCIEEMNFALSQMVNELSNGVFVDVHDDFLYKGKLNMNYSLDGLHLNDLGYNILSKRLSQVL